MASTLGTRVGNCFSSSLVRFSTALAELQKWTGWGARGVVPVAAVTERATISLTQSDSSNGFSQVKPTDRRTSSVTALIARLVRKVGATFDEDSRNRFCEAGV